MRKISPLRINDEKSSCEESETYLAAVHAKWLCHDGEMQKPDWGYGILPLLAASIVVAPRLGLYGMFIF